MIARLFHLALLLGTIHVAAAKPNVLIVTVDDMSCDSVGIYGCELEATTPHMDELASRSRRFAHAHVVVGNCYPSRNVLFSGLYPHNNGAEGFYKVHPIDYPTMTDLMQANGYYTAIRGKVTHSTPYHPYAWDADLTVAPDGSKLHVKDVPSYYDCTKRGIAAAQAAGKPFCLNINISDPHKPFWKPGDKHPTSRVFKAEEVPIPGFLFDDPQVREELALYYSSVRRADDCVGAILRALQESGQEEKTIVVFLSDHGMPLPFAKTQLYHHSTHTPLMIRWPGITEDGSVDETHLVSAVDFLPTLLEMCQLETEAKFDGRSFASLLRGETEAGWDAVYKVYNENSGGNRHPIRAIQTERFLYLFNPWSDGENRFRTATQGTVTYRRMQALAATDPAIAARLRLFDHRELDELYDVEKDPDCLHNLAQSPEYQTVMKELQENMIAWMKETGDHALPALAGKEDPAAVQAYMAKVVAEATARRADKRKANRTPNSKKKNQKAPKGKAKGSKTQPKG